ncbi:hypothetical protein Forpi1262_v017055 [Fusarium oxysporum f. sp. raphani]|uniref:HAT C-terminal dimerisation domain-containing protein n=1 Tax=Fusarium oxysporum f. sp. raphani TaxID=96318 RepID=A0A8J5P871_FUSOX|nr:hypothetical protein Forpi1262_v017055 [Fusarium oxysporum f. sp. raphani]
MLEEFSQQLHELDLSEIAAHSDTTTQQEQQQEERQEKPTRRSINAKDKRAATTHQQASNNDKRFAGWHGIPALAKLHVLAVYIRGSALHTGNDQWYDAIDTYYTMTEDVPVYAAALLLNPSQRKSYIGECWPEEWHEGAFAAARSLWKEEYNYDVEIQISKQSLAVPASLKRKKDTTLSKMRLELRNKTMEKVRGKDDFDSFISEAPIALAECTTPLQWCSEDVRTAYPRLNCMAIDILSIPAE